MAFHATRRGAAIVGLWLVLAGALAAFLNALGVDTLICGGIGAGARQALAYSAALSPGWPLPGCI